MRQIKADGTGGGTFSNHNVNGIILHGGIKHFLHLPVQAVYFIHKQQVALLKIVQDCSHFPGLFNCRAAGYLHIDTHFIGDNACQRGFAQAGRPVKQNMIQRVSALSGRLNVNLQVFLGLFLADIIIQGLGTQHPFDPDVLFRNVCFNDSRHVILHAAVSRCAAAARPLNNMF